MKIDRKLNLVIPLYREGEDPYAYVHAMAISREVFEKYHLVIARTFASLHNNGLDYVAGPPVAAMMLKSEAEKMGSWEGPSGAQGLLAEIRRLSSVLSPTPRGWESVPLQDAVDQDFLDSDDVSGVENALIFFTVASSMYPRQVLKIVLEAVGKLWGARTESLSCMDFAASLTTSNRGGNTGERETQSSIAY
jgi:hypothetical protein